MPDTIRENKEFKNTDKGYGRIFDNKDSMADIRINRLESGKQLRSVSSVGKCGVGDNHITKFSSFIKKTMFELPLSAKILGVVVSIMLYTMVNNPVVNWIVSVIGILYILVLLAERVLNLLKKKLITMK